MLDGIPIYFHLLGKILREPFVLVDAVEDKLDGLLPFNLHRTFSNFMVVEPRLRPPPHSGTVGIDAYHAWDVERLDVDVEFGERVDDFPY